MILAGLFITSSKFLLREKRRENFFEQGEAFTALKPYFKRIGLGFGVYLLIERCVQVDEIFDVVLDVETQPSQGTQRKRKANQ